ncbi:MAG: hypothetical protein LAP40_22235 [Acidobacteriia bacterium]|nr:hypothetical protein [Terriglobia bacterium]
MRRSVLLLFLFAMASQVQVLRAQTLTVRTTYQVKQLAAGAVYLDGGAEDGLKEGMHLKVSRLAAGEAEANRKDIGDLTVIAVASISAVCEVKESSVPVEVGDAANLSYEDAQSIQLVRSSKSLRHAAQTVSFTEGDPIDEELREYVPRPPSPEVNSFRGLIGFEQSSILDHTSGMQTMQEGLVVRADMHRIGGSYWNFTGYWRGRLSSQSGLPQQQTLNDLLNRTYQIGMYYNNPNSRYVAGFGRFLLPWAPSLSTIDGGYFGRRLGRNFTTGMFAGSTPNPTAWNYDPNRQMVGSFVTFEAGSYETVRYTSTAGAAVTRSHWHPEREFLFFENSFFIGTRLSLYHDLEVDKIAPALTSTGRSDPRLARSFATLRFQPVKRLSLDLSHNYFRDVPTFDLRLLGTGLLDQFLFQGLSGGFRLDAFRGVNLYGSLGRSKRDQDTRPAFNYMTGLVLPRLFALPHLPGLPRLRRPKSLPAWAPVPSLPALPGLPALPSLAFRTDFRYSKFASSFGSGSYASVTVSREIGDKFRVDLQAGDQRLVSPFTPQTRTKFGTATLDYLLGAHYLVGAGWTVYRGGTQNYDQTFVNLGYRF